MNLLILLALTSMTPPNDWEACGPIPGISVEVSPAVAAVGETVWVSITNRTNVTIGMPYTCSYVTVHVDDCQDDVVLYPSCFIDHFVPPGETWSYPWDQTNTAGEQVHPNTFAFRVVYLHEGNWYECCPTVEVCDLSATAAQEVVRTGTPANPNVFHPGSTYGPVAGQTWDPVIDHTTFVPNAVADYVTITTAPANLPTGTGTILCDMGTLVDVVTSAPGDNFEIPIPASCSIVGTTLCAQGVSEDPSGQAHFANALDLVIGTF